MDVNQGNIFDGLHLFPEKEVNSHRSEFVARLFSKELAIWNGTAIEVIKGEEKLSDSFQVTIESLRKYKRTIGFKFEAVVKK
ncbi:hypothetical protein N473_08595 [Pseudoalteromonas luteoviolacea CPMOR-1]|uniref:Uncharacterized protein n=1 Tax=Pseudoalteromonas luteoviolacea CPMOR-1 TaxID=1365248 RepID=A0A167MHV9_9GAMM|nr:hypothetical protein [Pseudoalteromonas luteoviolacea]KZN66439.1 hypothetical protein N473_08595 [Pseudoalteromonas luteoviolacea CPMOR-1]